MSTWQLQQAKSHLSEVVKLAIQHEPQHITVRGQPAVVLLAYSDYVRLTQPKPRFADFMRQSPLLEEDLLLIVRDNSLTRELDL